MNTKSGPDTRRCGRMTKKLSENPEISSDLIHFVMKAKYLDPFTDYGFKKIFGQEASKPLLRDFLNALLPPTAQIRELSFKNVERPGLMVGDRKVIFDIYCENEAGEKFIVEMQKAK